MDQRTARCLFENCAFLIIAGVPEGTEFGIDLSSYDIGENFRGVKMIPEGPHFVYCASRGPYGDVAARVGFVHYFKTKEIVVREWDGEKEELKKRDTKQEETDIQRIQENLKDLDKFLAPYDFEEYPKWANLTSHITEDVVQRLMPLCGLCRSAVEYLSCTDADRPRGSKVPRLKLLRSVADEDDLLPDLKPIPGTSINYTQIPKLAVTASPSDVSASYLDSIKLVQQLLQPNPQVIIAELQFAFMLLLVGHSTDSLAHWRRVLALVANSEESITEFRQFYSLYLQTIQFHLPELPVELMEPSKNNSVYQDVRKLLTNTLNGGLKSQVEGLKKVLFDKLNWKFDDLLEEDPEDLPVIVEI